MRRGECSPHHSGSLVMYVKRFFFVKAIDMFTRLEYNDISTILNEYWLNNLRSKDDWGGGPDFYYQLQSIMNTAKGSIVMTQNETTLLESKELRDANAGRIEVLEKVKELFLIPEINEGTMKMVSDYYEVDIKTIEKCFQRFKEELMEDGCYLKRLGEFHFRNDVGIETSKGGTTFSFQDGVTLTVPNRGLRVFSKRAILRIGMLLRDSEVAHEVRTQLLNTFEATSAPQRTAAIDEEQGLLFDFAKALGNGDAQEMFAAYSKLMEYKNRYITEIENRNAALSETNKALAAQELTWEDRAIFNKMVRIMAHELKTYPGKVFNDVYNELQYKHHIALKMRKKKFGESGNLIDYVRNDEWAIVWQVIAAIAETNNLDYADIKKRSRLED